FVEIDTRDNQFRFPRSSGDWTGKGIYLVPVSVYKKGFHAPSLGTIQRDVVLYIIAGSADGHYTTPEGEEWGWDGEGNTVDNMSGLAIVPLSTPDEETRNVMLIRSVTDTIPTIDVNCRGGDFLFHAGNNGHILQLEGLDRPDGDTDMIQMGTTGNRLDSFEYMAGQHPAVVIPKVGMVTGERKRAAFRWLGLEVPSGGMVGFEAHSEEEGEVLFRNNTGTTVHPFLHVQYVNGPMAATAERIYGPFTVPDGAEHTASLVGWPTQEEIFSQIDLDGDGTPEERESFFAQDCQVPLGGPNDCNRNGIRDVCEIVLGDSRDVNLDGVPDECFVTVVTATASPTMLTPTPTMTSIPQFNGFDANGDGRIGPEDLLLLMKEWHELVSN
ncbi:MAG: hypothetical protein KC944_22675, partial [Candidatus Omnitrophica bacterium]|nr:hypothetical protein [Candidatus Omnitrophota bacterium]